MRAMISRFAPAPTGFLHLGHVVNAIYVWGNARRILLRIEDHDRQRSRPEFEAAIVADLDWLGFTWDAPIVRQSERSDIYSQSLDRLRRLGLVYACNCSRAEIAGAQATLKGCATEFNTTDVSVAPEFNTTDVSVLPVAQPFRVMPFGNFPNVRILLYCSPEIGTYAGDVATFPDSKPSLVPERVANRLSRCMGPPGGTEGRADDAAPSRAQTARTHQSAVADADVSRDAGRRDIGRPPVPVVPPATRRQFVVGSATPLAVGDLCGLDAACVAAARDRGSAARSVLARVAAGRPRRHAIQADQHAADHGHARQSADPSRPRRVREDHDGRAAGTRPAQSAGRRDR